MFTLGWVYIIDNEAMPNILKIGFSIKNPTFHAIEFDGASSLRPFRVVFAAFVEEPRNIEQAVHAMLASKREANDWFRCSHSDAIAAIRACVKSILIERDNSKECQPPQEKNKMIIGWPRNAAGKGDAVAQYWFGEYYFRGQYIFDFVPQDYEQDYKESARWFRLSAEQGYDKAQVRLGILYSIGRQGVHQDYKEAVKWLRLAAEQGDACGQYRLGRMYSESCGVENDDEQAVYWFRKAADQGDTEGQCLLGEMYSEGRGVENDDEQAAYWFRKAANQGATEGQWRLGEMYSEGRGVAEDVEQATYWYRLAAGQGHISAQEALEKLGIEWEYSSCS